MFRRTKPTDPAAETVVVREGSKGRPTPSRKEAEAARRAKAKGPQNKKEAAKLNREQRAARSAKVRQGMRTGDERYLLPRDQGPVRRYIRDLVDSRVCMAEFLLPLLVIILVSQTISVRLSNGLWTATILVVGLDTVWLVVKLRRELRTRFPDKSTKGATGYALLRSLQMRFLRQPKTQVKLGAKLPEHY